MYQSGGKSPQEKNVIPLKSHNFNNACCRFFFLFLFFFLKGLHTLPLVKTITLSLLVCISSKPHLIELRSAIMKV